ncbi:specifically androgen-regulated gene protein [Thalassophryne amazonica]|uniref:specifically androgen-regulated gene protein n=1 Tax=Thalassophryne amazonica TaxID=390379 RepID=UPI001471DA45|nr:specifically androgen-regulated gene protein [Thalassophryne amazonica]XP_034019141.1 specifically androgen-regulated gene protein [Thalassophryne amazonica]
MDFPLYTSHQRHYGVNGGTNQNSKPGEDTLKFLSQEEQECIQFFEETIDYLEGSLEEDELKARMATTSLSHVNPVEVDGPASLSPKSPSHSQDIIDLVQPDLIQTKEPVFSPTSPDFQRMVVNPERHTETKPSHESMNSFPSEYSPTLPSGSYGTTESHASYHAPGSIPTPVLIAQKIAQTQSGGSSSIHPSTLLHRDSLENIRTRSYSTDSQGKHTPPTSTKLTRFPANINMITGNKEHQNQSLPNVSIHERQAKMLANLAGTSHLLLDPFKQDAGENSRNIPTRSISFKDPTPEISRMEALSKLGLSRNRAFSGGTAPLPNTTPGLTTGSDTNNERLVSSVPKTEELSTKSPVTTSPVIAGPCTMPPIVSAYRGSETSTKPPATSAAVPSQGHVHRPPETVPVPSVSRPDDKLLSENPAHLELPKTSHHQTHFDSTSSCNLPPEVSSLEVNRYGGKSLVVHPPASSRSEYLPSPNHDSKNPPPALANPAELNPYGGKSKVLSPAAAAVPQSDLPDILSSHIDRSQTSSTKVDALPIELNRYGGKSRTITPHSSSSTAGGWSQSSKPPAPATAPKPTRHSYHVGVNPQKMAQRAQSPDHRPKSVSRSAMFRPQVITVQFSGRGPTDDSRREALRRLGLLKDS